MNKVDGAPKDNPTGNLNPVGRDEIKSLKFGSLRKLIGIVSLTN
jgi:hypothetical protein